MTQQTKNLLEEKLAMAGESLHDLVQLQKLGDLAHFRTYNRDYYSVCYRFITGIEAVLDAAQLVLASHGRRAESQAGVAKHLLELGIFSKAQEDTLCQMYGFRNRLVHAYGTLDDDRVIAYLHERLNDMKEIIRVLRTQV